MQELYNRVPASRCKPGCCDCCSDFIQLTQWEKEQMGGYAYNGVCSHLIDGVCSVYESRPLVCRLYGASEVLSCDGCTPKRYLSAAETRELMRQYKNMNPQSFNGDD